MAGVFDATLKSLLDACAPDWVVWVAPAAGLPAPVRATALDAELSTVQPANCCARPSQLRRQAVGDAPRTDKPHSRSGAFRVRHVLRASSTYPRLREGRRVARHLGCEDDTGFPLAWARTPAELRPTVWRGAVLLALRKRFGAIPPAVEARVRAENDTARLEAALYAVRNLPTPDGLAL